MCRSGKVVAVFGGMGRRLYRSRYAVLAIAVVVIGLLTGYGHDYAKHFVQGGLYDTTSQSVAGATLADRTFGRDTSQDVVALYTAPPGRRLNDPDIAAAANATYRALETTDANRLHGTPRGFWSGPAAEQVAGDLTKQHGFMDIGLAGATDTDRLNNYNAIADRLAVPGLTLQLAGEMPLVVELNDGIHRDTERGELIGLPIVAILLLLVFGSVPAAAVPVLVGGLTVLGARGLLRLIMHVVDVNVFAEPVVTLVGLGLAIDYGLFTVSRFREELTNGRSVADAVAHTVGGAGRTITFSAAIIVCCLVGLVAFPIGFLTSLALAAISTIILAAALSVTVVPAILSVLGPRIDAFGRRRFARDSEFWSRWAMRSMRHPVRVAVPVTLVLLALIVPFIGASYGGVSERYFAPDNPTRVALEDFDNLFPGLRTDPLKLVVGGADNATLSAIAQVADRAPGLVAPGFTPAQPRTAGIDELSAAITDPNNSRLLDRTIAYLRRIVAPGNVHIWVTGTPALERDAINGMISRLPLLWTAIVIASFVLLYLAFGSFVLPIKAIVMSGLSLTATLGIISVLFYRGFLAGPLHFTPAPLMFPMLIIIIALVFGLSTDYEVFVISRMIEARGHGADTPESIRYGIAHTGGIITAAAAILIAVTASFGFSTLAPMKYLAFGMSAALLLDATIIRMLLLPAVVRMLGEVGWWAPQWALRLHRRLRMAETYADEAD